jgi:hypothetical protein
VGGVEELAARQPQMLHGAAADGGPAHAARVRAADPEGGAVA